MKKNPMLRTILLSTVFALLAVVLLAPTASAHATVPAHGAVTSQVPDIPNVDIVTRHGKAVFSPTIVRCKAGGHKKDCFTITNLTETSQKVLFERQTIATIPPGFVARMGVGISGIGFVLNLKSNPHARLTVLSS